MEYTLITRDGTVRQFYIQSVAEMYQQWQHSWHRAKQFKWLLHSQIPRYEQHNKGNTMNIKLKAALATAGLLLSITAGATVGIIACQYFGVIAYSVILMLGVLAIAANVSYTFILDKMKDEQRRAEMFEDRK